VDAPGKPSAARRNADPCAGDALLRTEPVDIDICFAAIEQNTLPLQGYPEMIAMTTLLDRIGCDLARDPAVHAITDITGLGVLAGAQGSTTKTSF